MTLFIDNSKDPGYIPAKRRYLRRCIRKGGLRIPVAQIRELFPFLMQELMQLVQVISTQLFSFHSQLCE